MTKSSIVEALRAKISHLEQDVVEHKYSILPAPNQQFADFLPDHGVRLGTFIEIIQAVPGAHSISLALLLAKHISELRPRWAFFDSQHSFNPIAALRAGWSADHLTLVRCDVSHAAWVFSQLLKSRETGVSIAFLPNLDNMVFRRFQLSAERGEGLGVVIRPLDAIKRPCWSSLRLFMEPLHGNTARISIVHAHGTTTSAMPSVEVAL